MKITAHGHPTQTQAARAESTPRSSASPTESGARARGASASERAAEVQMSDGARALRELRAPEKPDTAKIERLKAAIEDGSFQVDPERIASKMMEEES